MDVKEGDLVLLRSGGSLLTVTGSTEDAVSVAWSDGKHMYSHVYPRAGLWKVELVDLHLPAPELSTSTH